MIYALDTNIISFILRPSKNADIIRRFEDIIKRGHNYVIPPICYYEIYWYLLRKKAAAQIRTFNKLYALSLTEIFMGEADFIEAAEIRARLEEQGITIGNKDADIFIAAHCIVGGYVLVTDNTSDFERIGGVKFINWKQQDEKG